MTLPPTIWKAEDGRLYSSTAAALAASDDPLVARWIGDGNPLTPWPRDEAGEQTQAALDRVLAFYGIGQAPTADPVLTTKLDFYRRMTDAEADAVEMALAGAKVRDRRMFEEAQILNHADEDFARLRETVVGMFGQPRADELLAPSPAA